jgi:hypothetical protein
MNTLISYLREHYHINKLGDVTWAHAVNSQVRLKHFLHDPETMMLEADICISPRGDAIAAHPPANDSDLSFDELLEGVASSRQGIKLDFKDAEIVIPCLTRLSQLDLSQPVLLNADIFQGSGGSRPKFSAVGFLALCQKFYPQGIVSLGWTTTSGPNAAYTGAQIEEALELCRDVQQATFAVRASLLTASWQHVARLLQSEGYSLTIWNAEPVEQEFLAWMRENTDPAHTMYDLCDHEKNPIRGW